MRLKDKHNINTSDYWNRRFRTGDWALQGGYAQTRMFAEAQLPHLKVAADFAGSILDFGCGAGDAFPIYRKAWPRAKLIGVDFSAEAIRLCKERYGRQADFVCGGIDAVPAVDIIICSNVLEHVDDDKAVVAHLVTRSKTVYVVVPYLEHPLSIEHIRLYDSNAFSEFAVVRKVIFKSRGWTEFDARSVASIYLGNFARYVKGQPLRRRRMQILLEVNAHSIRTP